jgi:hypothetical protein
MIFSLSSIDSFRHAYFTEFFRHYIAIFTIFSPFSLPLSAFQASQRRHATFHFAITPLIIARLILLFRH